MVAINAFDVEFSDDMQWVMAFLLGVLVFVLVVLIGILHIHGHIMHALFTMKRMIEPRKAATHRSSKGKRTRFPRNPNVRFFIDPEEAEKVDHTVRRTRHERQGRRHVAYWTTLACASFYRAKDPLVDLEVGKVVRVPASEGHIKSVHEWV